MFSTRTCIGHYMFDLPSTPPSSHVEIVTIPALSDNYMYLIIDTTTGNAGVVDPVEPDKCIEVARKHGANITTVLTTHSHWDHAGGNESIAKKIPGITILAGHGDAAAAVTHEVGQDDAFNIGTLPFRVLYTPCHTPGHVCYVVQPRDSAAAVFTGDTMFISGCGNLNGGTPKMMHDAFVKLGSLPKDTFVYVGHEYTKANLEFAAFIEPDNKMIAKKLQWASQKTRSGGYTVPSSVQQEHECNPFLRAVTKQPDVMSHCGTQDSVAAFRVVRQEKSSGIHKQRRGLGGSSKGNASSGYSSGGKGIGYGRDAGYNRSFVMGRGSRWQ